MEQRLIDGLSLWAEMKRLEELARDRYLDTPSSSPAHTRYCEQMQERTRLKEMVSAMPTIDPVQAAGACRCGECKRWKPDGSYGIDLDGAKQPYGVCGVTHYCYKDNHFCSYGERSDQNA